MEANKVTTSHKPPSDGGMAREEFIRVGTTPVSYTHLDVYKRQIWNSSKVIDIVYRYESVVTSIDCFSLVCPYRSYSCYFNL